MARAARSRRSSRGARSSAGAKAGASSSTKRTSSSKRMGRGKRSATGIDIGHYSIKILSLMGDDEGQIDIRKITVAPVPPPEGAEYPEELHARQEEALKEAYKQHGALEGKVVVGLPRESTTVRYLTLPSSDPDEIREMLMYDVERHVPFPQDDLELAFQVLEQTGDHESRIMMICTPTKEIEPIVAMCNSVGIDIDLMLVNSLADAEAYKRILGEDETAAVVNVGRSSVGVGVIRNGEVLFSRSLPVTESFLLQGFPGAKTWKDLQGRVTAAGALNPNERDHFSAWVDRMGLELMRSFSAYLCEYPHHKLQRLILSGASGYFPAGPPRGLTTRVKTNAAIETPFNGDLPPDDSYRGTELATAFGLSLRGLNKQVETVNLIPKRVVTERKFRDRNQFRKNTLVLLFMVLTIISGTLYLRWYQHYTASSAIGEYYNELRRETNQINAMKNKMETVDQYLDRGNSATNIIRSALEVFPPQTYISNITFTKRGSLEITGMMRSEAEIQQTSQRLQSIPESAAMDETYFSSVATPRTERKELNVGMGSIEAWDFQFRCTIRWTEQEDQRR